MLSLALASLFSFVGCAKEAPVAKPGGGVVAQDGGITPETELPDDKDTRKFADHLVRNPVVNFVPSDAGGGFSIKCKRLSFGPKNHWEAEAVLSASGEDVDCVEAGRWSLEKAESATRGTVNLETKKTSCPGRSDSVNYRLVMDAQEGSYQIVFR